MAEVKEIRYGNGNIRVCDECVVKDPAKVQEIIDKISGIFIEYYREKRT